MNRWFTSRRGDPMSHATRLMVSILLVSCFSLVAIPASSAVQPTNRQAVKVDFKEVELPVFIRLVSDVTGKNFIFDEKITGKVTVITPEAVSVDGLYQLFLSILQFKGYAAVPTDNNLIQIIPLSEAKQNWTKVLSDENGQGFVTRLISLTYLNANEGIRILTPLVSKNGVISADLQTNTIILTDSAKNVERLASVLSTLDKEPPRGKGEINVYPLENAEAEEVAKTLMALFSKPLPAQSGQSPGQSPGQSVTLTGPVNVTADKATNSLVIVAAPEDYDAVKAVIRQLDIRRRQVYVEAAIIEISLSKLKQLGIEFRSVENPTNGSVTPFGGTNFGSIGSAVSGPATLANLTGLAAGVAKGFFTFGGTEYLNVGALVTALQTEEGVNILSTPHLLTTDNQKAEIVVGENVPFISAQSQTTGGNVLTNIDRKDVGITLRLTPRVSEGDFVKLDIYQEISALTDQAGFNVNTVGPVITKRYASTTVVAKDGETIAIGGLIKNNVDTVHDQIPILGDIPYLGRLFQYDKKTVDKTNLLIFITATIVKDTTLGEITERKKKEMERSKDEIKER